MIPILVDNASASSIEWVVNMIDDLFLSVDILEITSHINLLASGSIPVDGSSKNTIGGFPIIAIDTDNFLLLPPDKVPAKTFSYLNKSISSNFFYTNFSIKSYGIPLIFEYKTKCSLHVKFSKRASNYGQYPIKNLALSISVDTEYPSICASPDVIGCSPHNILNVEVFPAPFTPNKPKHSPFLIPKETLFTATFPVLYTFLNLLTLIV